MNEKQNLNLGLGTWSCQNTHATYPYGSELDSNIMTSEPSIMGVEGYLRTAILLASGIYFI